MPKTKYVISLSADEEQSLNNITHKGSRHTAWEIMHAQILLHSNSNKPDLKMETRQLAKWLDISPTTVSQIKKLYCEAGIETSLHRKTRITPTIAAKITGDFEAKVIATALGPVPEGYAGWMMLRLLAKYCMEKQYIISISHTKIDELLNSNKLHPHLSKY